VRVFIAPIIEAMATNSKSNKLPIFSGEFRHALDEKNRVIIPSCWRPGKPGKFFVFPNPTKPCLTAMPPSVFEKIGDEATATSHNVAAQAHRALVRHLYAKAQICTADAQGRMLVPEEFCKHAGLKNDAILAGGSDRFDIWNAAHWKQDQEVSKPTIVEAAQAIGL
jgi:MraZ protein